MGRAHLTDHDLPVTERGAAHHHLQRADEVGVEHLVEEDPQTSIAVLMRAALASLARK